MSHHFLVIKRLKESRLHYIPLTPAQFSKVYAWQLGHLFRYNNRQGPLYRGVLISCEKSGKDYKFLTSIEQHPQFRLADPTMDLGRLSTTVILTLTNEGFNLTPYHIGHINS